MTKQNQKLEKLKKHFSHFDWEKILSVRSNEK